MRRYALRDDQWERIRDLLPGREGHVGVTAKDNRLFVEAVLYRYRAGIPWRDLPERFGAWKKVHTRFGRWARTSVWERIFRHLAGDADNEYPRPWWVLSRSANPQPLQGFALRRRPWPGPTASSTSMNVAPSSGSSRPAPRSARSPSGSAATRPPSTASWGATASATATEGSAATSP